MRSPTSRVGLIEAEGIDLGSAKEDLNSILTLKAVKAALASSEQTFNNFDSQLFLESFKLSAMASDEAALHAFLLSWTTLFALLVTLGWSAVTAVPPLSSSELAEPILGWLQGNHLDPCNKKGIIEDGFKGETPKTPIIDEQSTDEDDKEEEDLIKEINPRTKGFFDSPKTSPAKVEYIDADEEEKADLEAIDLGCCRGRKSDE